MYSLRSLSNIEYSKVARFEPRATGRTRQMIMSLPDPREIDGKIFVVGLTMAHANEIRNKIREIRGEELYKKVQAVSTHNISDFRRGIDPLKFYFDHAALEYGSLKSVQVMYSIIDAQNEIWNQ